MHPLAVQVMQEANIDITGQHSKELVGFLVEEIDYIITVCDRARDNCPTLPGDNERIHWSFDDPTAALGDDEERLKVFRRVRNEIRNRILIWQPAILKKLRHTGIKL